MAAKTYLQLVNQVLRRLRESEVATVTETTYSTLISELINETKREVEDAWEWVSLRDTVRATTVADQFRYYLDVGNRVKLRSVFDDTNNTELKLANSKWLTEQFNTSPQKGAPQYYDFAGSYDADYQVDVYPIPNGAYTLNFNIIRPQPDLSLNAETLDVADWPVILGTYAKAVAERGDDNGLQYQIAYKAYQDALSDAIQLDAVKSHRQDWDWDAEYAYDSLGVFGRSR
jgi:hypothetical protein